MSEKGDRVKITIKGAGLTNPIEITDEGFIIDWSKGIAGQLPTGLRL